MIFYYVRHGDPDYSNDSLTPLGKAQADALAKRFTLHGLDEIYASPCGRAIETAKPTCALLKKEMKIVDWAKEDYAFDEFTLHEDGMRKWLFQSERCIAKLNTPQLLSLGKKWHTYPDFSKMRFTAGVERIDGARDAFFLQLGFEHDEKINGYKVLKRENKRVAMFAHEGFGTAFLSSILDIPYPVFCSRFSLGHSNVTIIYFDEKNDVCYPKIIQHSNDSHLYKEGILTPYQNWLKI